MQNLDFTFNNLVIKVTPKNEIHLFRKDKK